MMFNRDHKFWIRAIAIVGLLLLGFMIHHAADADHHADHNNCPLCLSLTGLIIVAAFALILYIATLLFQTRFQTLSAVSVDVDCPRKRGPPVVIIL